MTTVRLLDIHTESMPTRRLWVRDDCDGSTKCTAEMHIEEENNRVHAEVHLTYEECKLLRKALKRAMKEW